MTTIDWANGVAAVHVSLEDRGDLSARIYRQLLEAILDGRLRSGERLPPTRELARQLDVSRNTVGVAYDRLTAEGFLVGKVGAGTYVSTEPLTRSTEARGAGGRRAPGGRDVHPRRIWSNVGEPVAPPREPPPYDFSVGVPDLTLFPWETWRRLISRELRPSSVHSGDYGDPAGHSGLRAAIARHVGISRSVRAAGDDVLVTHGAQQALDLIGRVLVEPGMAVAVEEPGYRPARGVFTAQGARVLSAPVDDEGIDVDAIPRGVRLVYVTPSHQYPLGTPMSLARRTALLDWAHRNGAVIIEDDYDSEFRYSERPLEPLQSLDRSGRVIYVGSFSKTMLPMLRIGFLVAPSSLQGALRTAKQLSDWAGDVMLQGALARFLDEGLLARHIRRCTREYASRRAEIGDVIATELGDLLEVVPSAAGMHLCARAVPRTGVVWARAVEKAAHHGVRAYSLDSFYADQAGHNVHNGLVLGFGAVRPESLAEGLRRLVAAIRS